MEHYAGIDVSLELSSVCVLDATGRIMREAKAPSFPLGRGLRRCLPVHRTGGNQ